MISIFFDCFGLILKFKSLWFSVLKELARERLFMELEYERVMSANATRDAKAKENSLTAAAVGASLGAGLGIVLAVVMGAASALRKP